MRLTALPPRKRCTGTERSPGGLLTARKCVSSCTTCRGSLSDTSLMLAGARSNSLTTLAAAKQQQEEPAQHRVLHLAAWLRTAGGWRHLAAEFSYGKGTQSCVSCC